MSRFLTLALALFAVGLSSNAQVITPGAEIHPNGNANKCVEVRGGVFANGTPVQV